MIAFLALALFLIQLTLGANFVLLVNAQTGGDWTFLNETRRLAKKVPIALVIMLVYVLMAKTGWALARSIVYLALFEAISLVALKTRSEVKTALAMIVLFYVTTLGTYDWILALEPHWSSTIFGLLFLGGGFVGAIAFSLLRSETDDTLNGNLLLTGSAVWAYLVLSQLMVVWMGHIPEKLEKLTSRAEGPWKPVTFALWALAFLIPFFVLLFRDLKKRNVILALLSLGILVSRWLEISNWVFPTAPLQVAPIAFASVAAALGTVALWRFGE